MVNILLPDKPVYFQFQKGENIWNTNIVTNYAMKVEAGLKERLFGFHRRNLLYGLGSKTIRTEGVITDVKETLGEQGKCFNFELSARNRMSLLVGPKNTLFLLRSYGVNNIKELRNKTTYIHTLSNNQVFGISSPGMRFASHEGLDGFYRKIRAEEGNRIRADNERGLLGTLWDYSLPGVMMKCAEDGAELFDR